MLAFPVNKTNYAVLPYLRVRYIVTQRPVKLKSAGKQLLIHDW